MNPDGLQPAFFFFFFTQHHSSNFLFHFQEQMEFFLKIQETENARSELKQKSLINYFVSPVILENIFRKQKIQ